MNQQTSSATSSSATAGPFLQGVTVLELCHALAGPYAGAILADLGARVIKVEPLEGDLLRRRDAANGVAYPFHMVHRDKQSTAIDIKSPRGAELVRELMAQADIVIENFRPGVLKKYGLDGESTIERLPHIVYCSISGFGKTGPLAQEAGVDLVAQGLGGLMSVTGLPGGEPVKAGFPVADLGAGMWSVIGVLAALQRARTTGQGAVLDVALSDAILSWAVWEIADYQMTGVPPQPLGSSHRLVAPYRAYECAREQWINIAGIHSRWAQLCDLLGVPEIKDEPRFASESQRYRNAEALDQILAPQFIGKDRDSWIRDLRGIGVPCGPINNIAEAMEDEQFLARDMWRSVEYHGTSLKVVNTPIRDSAGGAPGPSRAAPDLGVDTVSILQELGLADDAIRSLLDDGVIGVAKRETVSEVA
jgi:crotonobetainyl-CoA:carnitine CoA-transferase CaiB-like acyl-CoA transferase